MQALYLILAATTLWPGFTAPFALLLGLLAAFTIGNPFQEKTLKFIKKLLAFSIVALGAGMNLAEVARTGISGLLITAVGIAVTLALGYFIGQKLKVERDTSLLISVGTAICGGSAIAAASQAIAAKPRDTSVALGTVFVLNSVALLVFPWAGHRFGLTEPQFGLWSALAIHDTSSVVGATMQYGPKALQIGTTVKLTRALWIVPLTLILGRARAKARPPWFILGFIAMAAIFTYLPALQPAASVIEAVGRRGLVLTLFLIGSTLSRDVLRTVGPKPFIQGVALWVIAALAALGFVLSQAP
jgi:uncharacterized integral membrane protein (TIGR00698 family)